MPETPQRLINGHPADDVAADDRGLAYGDGVFRTLVVVDGQPVAWAYQLARLVHDCARLALPLVAGDTLLAEIARICSLPGPVIAKILITRGAGGRGYMPPAEPTPTRVVSCHPMPDKPPASLALGQADVRLAVQPLLAGIKHCNRLEQVWARRECRTRRVSDLAMCDAQGRLIATTMRNLLLQNADGGWLTPRLDRAGVIGATRQRLMTTARERGRPVVETDVDASVLVSCEAAIACNSVGGAVAVTRIGDRRLHHSEAMAREAGRLLAETV